MGSYEMRTDHPCRDCGKLTPYFPQCLACTFENPRPEVDVTVPKSHLRRPHRIPRCTGESTILDLIKKDNTHGD